MSSQGFSDSLMRIYDAAYSPDSWTAALDVIPENTRSNGVMFYASSAVEDVTFEAAVGCSKTQELSSAWEKYNCRFRVKANTGYDDVGVCHLQNSKTGEVVKDTDIWSIDWLEKRAEVQFMKANMNHWRRFYFNSSLDPIILSGFLVYYPNDYEVIPKCDIKAVQRLAPHYAKALDINRWVCSLRAKYKAVLAVLDRIDIAILVLDDSSQVILANKQGQALLESRDGLAKARDGRLQFGGDDETAQARDAIRRLAQTARGENDDTSEVLVATRRSTGGALYGMISPLRDADMELEAGLHGALLTVIDPERPVRARVEAAARAYGLTPAEERVAVLLAGGLSNADIADSLSVSAETIKSHIASIFAKMQCRTRAAYVWRIFQFSPPIL